MISIREVAKRAGVSPSTVSRVLSGNARVEDVTRARVEKVISDTGYRPNINARSLRSRSGQLVGLVVPDMQETFSSIIHHAEHEAFRMGFGLIVGNTNGDPEKERAVIADLLSRNVDAIIFSRVSDSSHVADTFRGRRVPIVAIDRGIEIEDVPSVQLDNTRAGELVAELFLAGGHHDVGMVMGSQNIRLARERSDGFLRTLRGAGIEIAADHLYEGPFEFETGIAAARRLLATGSLPTAIWAQCDPMAVGLLHVFLEEGVSVPGDVSVVGMDNAHLARMVYPALTTINQPLEEVCSHAFALIARQIAGEEASSSPGADSDQILIEPDLVMRRSYRELDRKEQV